ncbi:MAG: DUF5672 family protein [Pseudomonadota bacterium]
MSSSAVVVVPVYQASPSAQELAVLARIAAVLGRHHIAFALPQGLDAAPYLAAIPEATVQPFAAHYFAGVAGYNRLMLAPEFYAAFADHDYLLIHQLDALVFRDELLDWCDKGYDYIGAPWAKYWSFWPAVLRWPVKAWRGALARRMTLSDTSKWLRHRVASQVGNGGLSLRRVQTFLDVLAEPSPLLDRYRELGGDHYNEDVFWSLAARHQGRPLKIPHFDEALRFAIEHFPARSMQRIGGLPFGCHAWDLFLDEWQPVFAREGIALP